MTRRKLERGFYTRLRHLRSALSDSEKRQKNTRLSAFDKHCLAMRITSLEIALAKMNAQLRTVRKQRAKDARDAEAILRNLSKKCNQAGVPLLGSKE